jgi:hypothetical protein
MRLKFKVQGSKLITSTYYLLLASCYLLQSCKSDKPNVRPENPAITLAGNASNVLVVNEGNFQFNNATISYLNGQSGQITSDIFNQKNNRSIGDVAQSATYWQSRVYVVINNSQKIEVLDSKSFVSIGSISGFVSPRYMLPVSNRKGYVSDLYSNVISVIDLASLSITKTIPCNGWTEQMILHLGKVYVTNYWQPYLYVIDPLTDIKSDSIYIGKGAQSIVADKNDQLIITCGGYKTPQAETKIVFLNPVTKSISKTISFAIDNPSALTINATKDTIYYLKTDVFKIAITDENTESAFIQAGARKWYGLGLDPVSNQVFVSDAVDYVQKGKVYVFSSSGTELAKFDAGINPNGFCFY